jgi:hypothetical protein
VANTTVAFAAGLPRRPHVKVKNLRLMIDAILKQDPGLA